MGKEASQLPIDQLDFPLAKAEYLFNHTALPGKGGDKQKFWRVILGFQDPQSVREAILSKVAISQLVSIGSNQYGERYQAIITIQSSSNDARRIRTVWIVLFEERIARFVTAVPQKDRRLT